MARKLSHVDRSGRVRMVDVSRKRVTTRTAVARGRVFMHRDTLDPLRSGRAPKGDVLAVAHLAGVMAAKRTSELVPLAHPLALYDMLKAVDRGMVMGEFALWEKRGGRSGVYRRAP